ncbi:LIS1-interacting protein NUDE [Phaffia rhodozyma]|uniref:LIS1-interacting protein NUDE n=1 Tax=Phaffia rhodozyma TaxID=264483 RepID=A0A0F7SQN0_PHARH|nr:LIS1-interacting protein NUDE [Phaffia rhodozyma]
MVAPFDLSGSDKTTVSSYSDTEDNDREVEDFSSAEVEAAHFRSRYLEIYRTLQDTKAELDEFQTSSKELEEELERELAATEAAQEDLKNRITRLEAEKEEWKAKHLSTQKAHNLALGSLQRELDAIKAERDRYKVSLRDLEMGVDDLERNERMVSSSLQDMESRYNRAIEEKTLLEQELIDKQELEEETQRLKDEMRDLLSELSVLKQQQQCTKAPSLPPASPTLSEETSVGSRPTSLVRKSSQELSMADLMMSPPSSSSASTSFLEPVLASPSSPSLRATRTSSGLPKSHTSPSISHIVRSPSRLPIPGSSPNRSSRSGITSSTTSRNLSLGSTITSRTVVSSPLNSTLKPVGSNQTTTQPAIVSNRPTKVDSKSRGVRMVSDLGERVRTLQSRIQTHNLPRMRKVTPGNVSSRANPGNPLSPSSRRQGSIPPLPTLPTSPPINSLPSSAHPRMKALADRSAPPRLGNGQYSTPGTPGSGDWVLVSENEESPTALKLGARAPSVSRPSARSSARPVSRQALPSSPLRAGSSLAFPPSSPLSSTSSPPALSAAATRMNRLSMSSQLGHRPASRLSTLAPAGISVRATTPTPSTLVEPSDSEPNRPHSRGPSSGSDMESQTGRGLPPRLSESNSSTTSLNDLADEPDQPYPFSTLNTQPQPRPHSRTQSHSNSISHSRSRSRSTSASTSTSSRPTISHPRPIQPAGSTNPTEQTVSQPQSKIPPRSFHSRGDGILKRSTGRTSLIERSPTTFNLPRSSPPSSPPASSGLRPQAQGQGHISRLRQPRTSFGPSSSTTTTTLTTIGASGTAGRSRPNSISALPKTNLPPVPAIPSYMTASLTPGPKVGHGVRGRRSVGSVSMSVPGSGRVMSPVGGVGTGAFAGETVVGSRSDVRPKSALAGRIRSLTGGGT